MGLEVDRGKGKELFVGVGNEGKELGCRKEWKGMMERKGTSGDWNEKNK